MPTDYAYAGEPDLTLDRFRAIIPATSPGHGEAAGMYGALTQRGVRPSVFLAHWHHESRWGTDPASVEARYQTANPGAVRTIQNPEHGGWQVDTDRGPFAAYPSYEAAARDWADRIRGEKYEGRGLLTVRQVIPRYAPSSDGNAPERYIAAVLADVEAWTMADDGMEYRGQPAGEFAAPPKGIILHGSRSGRAGNPLDAEFLGTCRWAANNPLGLAWHATIGPGVWAAHLTAREWGWHAREHSSQWLGVEFAQPTVDDAITDGQVAAFVAWYRRVVLPAWPALTPAGLLLPSHAEMPAGKRDGKTDPYPTGDARMEELRRRIYAALGGSDDALFDAYAAAHGLGAALWSGTYPRDWAGTKIVRYDSGRVLALVGGAVVEITGRVADEWETAYAGEIRRF